MALLFGAYFEHQSASANKPHIFSFATSRGAANDTLWELWNGGTSAARKAAVDLNGKYYSAALTAGDMVYAVTGGVTSLKRLDSLAIGTAGQFLQVNTGATAPEWTSVLSTTFSVLGGTTGATALRISDVATDATNKLGYLVGRHYTNAQADFLGMLLSGSTSDNRIYLGGGSASRNAATQFVVFTAATNTTVTGSIRFIINNSGVATFGAVDGTGSLQVHTGALNAAGLVTALAGLTVSSGQTLTLTGTTITGTPTWSSTQGMNISGTAATVTTAAQPAITSVGTLTSLSVGAITSTGLIQTTLVTQQLSLRYDTSNHLAMTVGATGIVTYNATGAAASHSFVDRVDLTAGNATAISLVSGGAALVGSRNASTNTSQTVNTMGGTLSSAASGTHPELIGTAFSLTTTQVAAAAATVAATVKIAVPVGSLTATTVLGLWVVADSQFDGAIVVGAPTGGNKGTGTINATAVYDDNTQLTDFVFERFHGLTPTDRPDYQILSLPDLRLLTATEFRLPSMPLRASFEESRSLGRLVTGLWEATELNTVYLFDHERRIAVLETENHDLRSRLAALNA